MLDEEFEYVQQATNAYLDQEPFISSSVDGWERHRLEVPQFFFGIVDDPGEVGDAESYKTALEPGLKRRSNVGACTDNPSMMVKARNTICQDPVYSAQVWFHAIGMQPISSCMWK